MKVVKAFCLFYLLGCVYSFNGLSTLYNTHEEPPVDLDDYKSAIKFTVKEKWIEQKLDHFNEEDSRVWMMRYLKNDRFFQPGGPIFIYIGGEWEISAGWISTGHMFDMAKEFNGSMYYTEHRYYGKSLPTDDTSTKNLEFLTVEQALADLAHFVRHLKSSCLMKDSGIVVVGASYSATVATWARMRYPQLIDGAWASSAPLHAKLDFYEYNEIMTESLRLVGGKECVERFEDAFKTLEEFVELTEPKSLGKIQKDFKLCEPLKLSRDVQHFFYEMSDTVAGLVQSHKSGDIEKACRFMLNETHSDSVAALGAWVNVKNTKKCMNMNYDDTVRRFNNVTWGSAANKQLRQWTYQTCDRFGWFQTGNSENQAFGSKYPQVGYFTKMCRDLFGKHFTFKTIQQNVEETNEMFGGLNLNVTNVYSTHGYLDPWRAMGLQGDLHDDAQTVILNSYSHVPDLYSISSKDTPQMKASKLRIRDLVISWLNIH